MGFKATEISTDFDTLKTIKIPALLYLKYRDQDHFSVLRVISDSHVLLADSSWGNKTFTVHQFNKLWLDDTLKGKVLVIVPDRQVTKNVDFFRAPKVNNLPIELLSLR